jgi:hypothetical protein
MNECPQCAKEGNYDIKLDSAENDEGLYIFCDMGHEFLLNKMSKI